jgi:hypothetical protein
MYGALSDNGQPTVVQVLVLGYLLTYLSGHDAQCTHRPEVDSTVSCAARPTDSHLQSAIGEMGE